MSDSRGSLDALAERVEERVSPQAADWLRRSRLEVRRDVARLGGLFPAAGRHTGHGPLLGSGAEKLVRLFSPQGPILDPWRIDDAARVILLLEYALREPARAAERANELYFTGDARERVGVLRGLQLLAEGDQGLPAVRDALRASAIDLFAAAICENLYTSRRLPDALFFQAVLKCAFCDLELHRIELVEERATAELSRMLFAYVTEREHAGRGVAPDLWPLIALFPPPGAAERIEVALGRAER